MTRDEFLRQLRLALSGRVPVDEVDKNVRYYEDYLMTGVRKGQSESDLLDSLGDPRLIARSIIAAYESGHRSKSAGAQAEETYEEEAPKKNMGGISLLFKLLNLLFWNQPEEQFPGTPLWMLKAGRVLLFVLIGVLVLLLVLLGLTILPYLLVLIAFLILAYYIRNLFRS